MVFAYPKLGRGIVLKVETSACFTLVMVTFICCENVSFGSRVIPRILECFVVGNVWLLNLNDRIVSYSAGSG